MDDLDRVKQMLAAQAGAAPAPPTAEEQDAADEAVAVKAADHQAKVDRQLAMARQSGLAVKGDPAAGTRQPTTQAPPDRATQAQLELARRMGLAVKGDPPRDAA